MPSLSYRFNDQLSFGGGITINHTQVYQDLSPTVGSIDMDLSLEAESVDYGWTLGGLYEFNAQHRVGVVYRSGIEADLDGEADLLAAIPSRDGINYMNETLDAELNWENASNIVISGYHELNNEWAMMWDLGRTFYSEFEQTDIVATGLGDEPIVLEVHRNWQDANRYALGTHYKLNDKLTLQAGFSYDESVVTDEYRSADLPLDDIKRYTLGSLYQVTDAVQLAFGLEYAQLGSANIEAPEEGNPLGSPQGSYESSAVATSFAVNYQF
jgi:long-chain fatty acid transport protein